MGIKFSNLATTTLASGITNSATTITVADGSVFPALGSGDFFFASIDTPPNAPEIVKVTAISSNTLTVVRGQDGTTATSHNSSETIALRVVAAVLEDLRDNAGETYTAGSGISLSGTTFINSAPDQTVSLTGSGATSVSGTYPNFTISSTDTNTNTTYTAGTNLSLSGTTFNLNTNLSGLGTISSGAITSSGRGTFDELTLTGSTDNLTFNEASGDWTISNAQQNNGITIYDGTAGVAVNYNGATVAEFAGGGGMNLISGSLRVGGTAVIDSSRNLTNINSVEIGSKVTLAESTDRADLLQITGSTGGWAGLQIRNSNGEGRWSFMTDSSKAGIYDDENNKWHIYIEENSYTQLRHNNNEKLTTTSTGVSIIGVANPTLGYQVNGTTVIDSSRNITSGRVSVSGLDQSFVAQRDLASSTGSWSARIISSNATTNVAAFLGNYQGYAGLFGHNAALNAWSPIYINAFGSTGNANVYTGPLYINGAAAWHAGNDGSGSGLDADTLDGMHKSVEFGPSAVGNFGQWQNHSTYTNFNTDVAHWGWNFVQGNTNAPNTNSDQWYRNRVSLGDQYGFQSGSGDYWLEMAYPRTLGSAGGLWLRACENGSIGSWYEAASKIGNNTTWHAGNDGSGSGLDADLLDGLQASQFLRSDAANNNYSHIINLRAGGNHLGNHEFAANTLQTAYSNSSIELREANYGGNATYSAPRISFHWGGVVASSIAINTSGHVLIQNNPGTGYETFRAGAMYSSDNIVWHAGNDGSGSGLDADLLDGLHSTSFASNTFNVAGGASTSDPNSRTDSHFLTNNGNAPFGSAYSHIQNHWWSSVGGNVAQHATTYNGSPSRFAVRHRYSGTWTPWSVAWTNNNDGSGSGLDADLLDGYHASTTRDAANTIPIRDGNGYANFGWINTTSGATTSTISRIYASNDGYIRYITPSTFRDQIISGQTINEIYNNGWYRTNGTKGWYNQSYGGGLYMVDTTWVRVYNGKRFYVPNEIAATGNVTAYYSDERLKTKTGSIENALQKVQSLEGFTYVENDLAKSVGYSNDKQQVGVSAQQVQSVLPEAVSLAPFDYETNEETGEITSKSGEEYLTVDYSRLVPLLIESIKELKTEVDDLKEQLRTK